MKKFLLLLVSVLFAASVPLLTSCSKHDHSGGDSDVLYYTCAMHPSVKTQNPKDKCPICAMDLIPVKKKPEGASGHEGHGSGSGGTGTGQDGLSEFTVPVVRQQQIGVTYAKVEERPLIKTVRAVGTVAYNKQRHWDYVSRVDGYVQDLKVSSRGEIVEEGQPLLTIYSPELLTTQREFLDLLRMRDRARESGSKTAQESAERLLDSARRRLQLWNIGTNQVAELERTREATDSLTLYSPFRGVVQNLSVDQGSRVTMGQHLVDIADLSVVWVWAEFYQDELPLLQKGLPVTITTTSYPGGKFNGKIGLVDPFINPTTRTVRARIDVENPELKLRPDMYVNVEISVDRGTSLTVPVTAIMPTGERNIAFVDKGEGRLDPRFVEVGEKFQNHYQVLSGLSAGERVVNSANFLIDAEAKVQGALQSW